jgi:hypothetical protein
MGINNPNTEIEFFMCSTLHGRRTVMKQAIEQFSPLLLLSLDTKQSRKEIHATKKEVR